MDGLIRARPGLGLAVALLSAAAFGASGPFAKPLLDAGWSPAAAVGVRAGAAGLVLLPFALVSLRASAGVLGGSWRRIAAFGLIGVAGCQLCYFAAIERLPVGVALLIEYLGPVLLVGFTWATTRARPARSTLIGAAVSTGGLVLVLDLTGATHIDLVGVAWALGAAVCLGGFFLISAHQGDDLPPVALASIGLLVGAVGVTAVGLVGAVPLTAVGGDVELLDGTAPWYVPMAVVVLVSSSFAYAAGVYGAAHLGSRLASFVGLVEVLFAVLLSWVLLDEVPTVVQALGGALIVVGVLLVRSGDREVQPLEPLPASEPVR
ncbi:EamA family transporter [soil metagenome]